MNLEKGKVFLALVMLVMSGCSVQEGYRSYESAEVDNNGVVKNRLVEEYVSPDKKRIVSKQITREKVQCIGPDGRPIPANSPDSCSKKKGKFVDERYQEETVIRSK
jgi:hypothetical protein